jgi:hypothetical protein
MTRTVTELSAFRREEAHVVVLAGVCIGEYRDVELANVR